MLRNDFVSNSSSSSFVVALTNEEEERAINEPQTILDFILRSKRFDFVELNRPQDNRQADYRFRDWRGKPRKVDKTKYEDYVCPWKYNQQTDFIVGKSEIEEYAWCCEHCIDNKECYDYSKIKKCLEEVKKGKKVFCFELRNTDPIYIDDTDFSNVKDPHVIDDQCFH